jgi:hypothetical protein
MEGPTAPDTVTEMIGGRMSNHSAADLEPERSACFSLIDLTNMRISRLQ